MFNFDFGHLTFTTRNEYLAYRADWKNNYKILSQDIRDTREAIKQAYANNNQDRASILQYQKSELRKTARKMMEELADAKVEAQRQYEAQKEKTHA